MNRADLDAIRKLIDTQNTTHGCLMCGNEWSRHAASCEVPPAQSAIDQAEAEFDPTLDIDHQRMKAKAAAWTVVSTRQRGKHAIEDHELELDAWRRACGLVKMFEDGAS